MKSAFGVEHDELAKSYEATMSRAQKHRRAAARNSQAANVLGAAGATALALPLVAPKAMNRPIRALGRLGEAKMATRGLSSEWRIANPANTGNVRLKDVKRAQASRQASAAFGVMRRNPESVFAATSGAAGVGALGAGVATGLNSWRHQEKANRIARGWNKKAAAEGAKARMAIKPISNKPRQITG